MLLIIVRYWSGVVLTASKAIKYMMQIGNDSYFTCLGKVTILVAVFKQREFTGWWLSIAFVNGLF